jgi:preprotein translocase subunit SecE
MAVADVEKVEKSGDGGSALPSWASSAVSFVPNKFGEGKAFITEVRSELKKVTWPSRQEVYTTTMVVIATTIFFGFYLWGLDLAFSRVMSLVLK